MTYNSMLTHSMIHSDII